LGFNARTGVPKTSEKMQMSVRRFDIATTSQNAP